MEGDLRGQAEIWELMLSHANSMALKCAVELGIPDIIQNSGHGDPIPLSHIASQISCRNYPSPESTAMLRRVMNLLVRRNVFSAEPPRRGGGETLYGLTPSSTWLLTTSSSGLGPMVLLQTHEAMVASWGRLSERVREGGGDGASGFKRVNGVDFYEDDGEFAAVVRRGFGCTAGVVAAAAVEGFGRVNGDDLYEGVGSVVDVGGGTGGTLAEIVKKYPRLKGVNFDLPPVVAAAPEYPGVRHVGGDMFHGVPQADVFFLKWVLHNWSDEDCLKILKNCRKVIISKKTGKLIIVEIVLEDEGKNNNDDETLFGETALILDLAMIAYHSGGKERTAKQWKELLTRGGFCLHRIINIPALPSIIEAFPK